MSYQVLARKWRPQNFSELVGQEHVKTALTHALNQNRLHHAYLFTGTRGVGKTTIARIFAKSLNCELGVTATPCGVCSACTEIDQGFFVDLLEIDAASRTKVEDTRDLLDNVQYAPSRGRYKVYLIDEVHMLSRHSFNALLKTLEEPPPHVKFLLATTDPQKLPITVLSRCLQFSLKALSQQQIKAHLAFVLAQEQVVANDEALALLARAAKGSLRDSLSLTDQAIAQTNGNIQLSAVREMLGYLEQSWAELLLQDVLNRDLAGMQHHMQQLVSSHGHYQGVLDDMLSLLHLIALSQFQLSASELALTESVFVRTAAKNLSAEAIQLYYQLLLSGKKDLPFAPEPRIGLEMALLRAIAFVPQKVVASEHTSPRGAALNAAFNAAQQGNSVSSVAASQQSPAAYRQTSAINPTVTQSEQFLSADRRATAEQPNEPAGRPAAPEVPESIEGAASNAGTLPVTEHGAQTEPQSVGRASAQSAAVQEDDSALSEVAAVSSEPSSSLTASILARRLGGGAAKKSEVKHVATVMSVAQPESQTTALGRLQQAATSQAITPTISSATSQVKTAGILAPDQSTVHPMPAKTASSPQPSISSALDLPPWEELPSDDLPLQVTPAATMSTATNSEMLEPAALPAAREQHNIAVESLADESSREAQPKQALDQLDDEDEDLPALESDWQWQALNQELSQEFTKELPAAQPIRHVLLDALPVTEAQLTDFASEQIEEIAPAELPTQPLAFDGEIHSGNFALRSAAQVDDWARRIDSLRIGGLMRLFLLNSSVTLAGSELNLQVANSQRHLDSERNRQQLAQVLSESFGQQLVVDVQFVDTVPSSPQMLQQQIDAARRRYVQQVLEQDPALSALRTEFGAEWLSDSLEVF